MRWGRILSLIILLILISGGIYTCLGRLEPPRGSMRTPLATVKSTITRFESMDPEQISVYFTPIPASVMTVRLKKMFEYIDKLDIQNLDVILISNDGVGARVRAVYDMVITHDGYVDTERCHKQIKLVFLDDQWFINEAF